MELGVLEYRAWFHRASAGTRGVVGSIMLVLCARRGGVEVGRVSE